MDITRSVTVPVAVDEAFRLFTEQPGQWLPPAHTFIRDPVLIAMEPWAGGRFYERGADGTEITRGTILDWAPPNAREIAGHPFVWSRVSSGRFWLLCVLSDPGHGCDQRVAPVWLAARGG